MTSTPPKSQNIQLAVIFALVAAVTFAIASVFVKLIGNSLPTTMVVFFRFVISLIILLPWFLSDSKLFQVNQPIRFILRSICGMLSLACMFYAFKYIPLADGLLLNNTNALFVPIVAWIMLRTVTPLKIWLAILVGFIGVIFILHPGAGIINFAAIIGLASGVFGAISLVQIRQLTKVSSTQQILFYYFITGAVITGIILPFLWKTPTLKIWLLLLGVGFFSTIFQIFIVLSFTYAPVRLMSAVMFSAIVFGAVFDWLIWHELPNYLTIIGMVLVIVGGISAIYFGQTLVKNSR
jgi:drug/metabolite transporter (DMT)-like permease